EVEITSPFYLGVYPVTQEEYQRVMGVNPSHYSLTGRLGRKVRGQDTSRFPVEGVNWGDAIEFCRRLSGLPEEKNPGRVYRLPTEAKWEYACRAGTRDSSPYYFERPSSSISREDANCYACDSETS